LSIWAADSYTIDIPLFLSRLMVRLRRRKEERRAAAKLANGVLHAAQSKDGFSSVEAFADGVVLGGRRGESCEPVTGHARRADQQRRA
jgi:hypothetical protein